MDTSKKIKLLDFQFKKHLGSSLFGVYKSAFIGSGVEFASLREYEVGESLKNIDWKTTAKKGKLFTKQYEEERDLNVFFVIDNAQSMQFGSERITKKELGESLIYALGLSAVENSDNVGGCIFQESGMVFLPAKKSIESLFLLIDTLEHCAISPENNVETMIEYLLKKHIKNSFIVVVSDQMYIKKTNLLKSLSLQNQVLYVNIGDYFENHLLDAHGDMALGNLMITLGGEKKRQAYESLRRTKRDMFQKEIEAHGCDYIFLDAKVDMYAKLFQYFYKIK